MENWKKAAIGIASAAGVFSIFIFFKWACHVDYRQAQITEVRWEHWTFLRERMKKGDGDWGRPPRSGGYYREPTFDYHCRDKQDGTWCCGGHTKDGMCQMECPTYSEWCDYHYWDWPKIEKQPLIGLGEEGTTFSTFGTRLDNNHRETQEKFFYVTFQQQGKNWVYGTRSDDEYKRYIVGDIWEIRVPRFGDRTPSKRAHLERP